MFKYLNCFQWYHTFVHSFIQQTPSKHRLCSRHYAKPRINMMVRHQSQIWICLVCFSMLKKVSFWPLLAGNLSLFSLTEIILNTLLLPLLMKPKVKLHSTHQIFSSPLKHCSESSNVLYLLNIFFLITIFTPAMKLLNHPMNNWKSVKARISRNLRRKWT